MKGLEIVATSPLPGMTGWDELTAGERAVVETETRGLASQLVSFGRARLALGEHLSKIHEVLEPKRLFKNYLEMYNLSRSTAYEYITAFRNASQYLRRPVLEAAMARNMSLLGDNKDAPLGVYTAAFKRLPPPEDDNPEVLNEYLDNLEKQRKRLSARGDRHRKQEMEAVDVDTDVMMMEVFRFADLRLQKMPKGRGRSVWVENLSSYLFARAGAQSSRTVEPRAVPEGFIAKVGRPRIVDAEEQAA